MKTKVHNTLFLVFSLLMLGLSMPALAGDGHDDHDHDHGNEQHEGEHHENGHDENGHHDEHGDEHHGDGAYDPVPMIMHHIADAHSWHFFDIGETPVSLDLPVILWTYEGENIGDAFNKAKFHVFMSTKFHHGHSTVKKGDEEFELHLNHTTGQESIHELGDRKVIDLSITKNVAAMFLSIIVMLIIFSATASKYKKSLVPSGIARIMEPIILFVRDDIAVPNIGEDKAAKYMPFLLSVFFFIWVNNLLGLLPGAANLTGNISVTMTLALFTLVIVNINGNKHYWSHILTPPVPWPMWVIMVPVEIIGIITKPFALMIRLFANITAGHILILSLVSLIFIFQSVAMAGVSVPFMIFMNGLELLVAVLQAYIFTLLSALFIGMAVEEPAHH